MRLLLSLYRLSRYSMCPRTTSWAMKLDDLDRPIRRLLRADADRMMAWPSTISCHPCSIIPSAIRLLTEDTTSWLSGPASASVEEDCGDLVSDGLRVKSKRMCKA